MESFTYQLPYGGPPFIGIIEDKFKQDYLEEILFGDKSECWWDQNGYELCGRTGAMFADDIHCNIEHRYKCKWQNDGDILQMTLDLDEKKLSFKVNDEDFGVAFTNIDQRKYRLAFSTFIQKNQILCSWILNNV